MAITETSAAQLIINQLTREQYNNLETIANNELYIIDENILSAANAYFKNQVDPEELDTNAYTNADVVNKAYVTKVVDNINDSLIALTAKHDGEISAKQDRLTDSNEGAYIDITAHADSSKTTIAVKNVVSAGTDISAEGTQSYLTTSKAVKEYVEATVATTAPISHTHAIDDVTGLSDALDDKQDNLTPGSYIKIENDIISVSAVTTVSGDINNTDDGLTTGKAVHDYVAVQIDSVNGSLAAHINDANRHVTAEQKANWTSTSTTVAETSATWNSALQEISSATTDYITIVNKDTVSAIITTDKLDEIDSNTKGIVPPSVIAALNAKVNELQQIPQFTVVVAYSINLDAKTYKLTEGGDDNDCVQNTVYLVPDSKAAAGAYIEYLCYKAGEILVIEQIGTTEIDLSDYAKTEDISGGFDEHGVKVDLTDGKLTGGVTPGSIEKDNDSVVTGGAVYDYVAETAAPISHKHEISAVNGLQDALDAKQDNLIAGSYITIENDTISVSAVTTTSAAVELGNTGLTTGNAVREALNSMIVFKKYN